MLVGYALARLWFMAVTTHHLPAVTTDHPPAVTTGNLPLCCATPASAALPVACHATALECELETRDWSIRPNHPPCQRLGSGPRHR